MAGTGTSFLSAYRAVKAFERSPGDAKRIVIYSEGKAYWPFLRPFVSALVTGTREKLSYVSSEPDDPGLAFCPERVAGYVVGSGFWLTWWFATLKAGVLLLTMPDLDLFHLKRSFRAPVHYVYANHGCDSLHMVLRERALDRYDTLFCAGPHNVEEVRRREALFGLRPKQVLEIGYPHQDELIEQAARSGYRPPDGVRPIRVLLAPSWSPAGLGTLETCGTGLTAELLGAGFEVTVRPHPQTRKRQPECVRSLERDFAGRPGFRLESSEGDSPALPLADVLISDWSAIALEFAFATLRPVLYLDVPRKVLNPRYEALGIEPFEVRVRREVGAVLAPGDLAQAPALVTGFCRDAPGWAARIRAVRDGNVYHVGHSAPVGAAALVELATLAEPGPEGKP